MCAAAILSACTHYVSGAAEAIEAIAHGDRKSSKVIGRKVSEIHLPPATTIGAIIRDDRVSSATKTLLFKPMITFFCS